MTSSRRRWREALPQPPTASSPATLTERTPTKRAVTVEELLTWTYAEQRAHRYLKTPQDWVLWALDESGVLELAPRDRRPVHRDAALVHEAVVARGSEAQFLALQGALTGEWPAPCTAEPRPVPIEPFSRHDEYGRHKRPDGTLFDYCIRTLEVIQVEEEEWVVDGRKRMRRRQVKRTRKFNVQYCPIGWRPAPEYIEMTEIVAAAWRTARAELEAALAAAPFKAHILRRDGSS